MPATAEQSSQRSRHSPPIFRLLLKVAVNGTHQCDFHNFWGASAPTDVLHSPAEVCEWAGCPMFVLCFKPHLRADVIILAEGAIALSVLSGGALFAS